MSNSKSIQSNEHINEASSETGSDSVFTDMANDRQESVDHDELIAENENTECSVFNIVDYMDSTMSYDDALMLSNVANFEFTRKSCKKLKKDARNKLNILLNIIDNAKFVNPHRREFKEHVKTTYDTVEALYACGMTNYRMSNWKRSFRIFAMANYTFFQNVPMWLVTESGGE